LCEKSDVHSWWKKKGKWGFSSAVHDLRSGKMAELRTQIERAEPSNGNTTDMPVTDFWEKVYLPRLEEIVALTAQPRGSGVPFVASSKSGDGISRLTSLTERSKPMSL
jgi:hypothetical protein